MTMTIDRRADRPIRARTVTVTQYSKRSVFTIWAAAAIPMGILSWIVAPAIADANTIESLMRPLLACMTAGLIWVGVLAFGLVAYEQRSLRWSRIRDAMWLHSPTSPKTGRVGGKTWFVLVPLIVVFFFSQQVGLPTPISRDFGEFLQSDAGRSFFHAQWGLLALFLVMGTFNTMLGEEILFRGVLLPRMHDAFGDNDWKVNGVLFALYHLHVPWAMASALIDGFVLGYFTKKYRSSWIGIIVHSTQTVVIGLIILSMVV